MNNIIIYKNNINKKIPFDIKLYKTFEKKGWNLHCIKNSAELILKIFHLKDLL